MKIIIKRYPLLVRLGVYAGEQDKPQEAYLSLKISLNDKLLPVKENLEATVDYAKLFSFIDKSLTGKSFSLIEDMVWFIGEELKTAFPSIKKIKVEVEKTCFPGKVNKGAQISITHSW